MVFIFFRGRLASIDPLKFWSTGNVENSSKKTSQKAPHFHNNRVHYGRWQFYNRKHTHKTKTDDLVTTTISINFKISWKKYYVCTLYSLHHIHHINTIFYFLWCREKIGYFNAFRFLPGFLQVGNFHFIRRLLSLFLLSTLNIDVFVTHKFNQLVKRYLWKLDWFVLV